MTKKQTAHRVLRDALKLIADLGFDLVMPRTGKGSIYVGYPACFELVKEKKSCK